MTIEIVAWLCTLTVNAVLAIIILHQRSINKKYQHAITQNMVALRQAERILKGAANARKAAKTLPDS